MLHPFGPRTAFVLIIGVIVLGCRKTPKSDKDSGPSATSALPIEFATAVTKAPPTSSEPSGALEVVISNAWLMVVDPGGARTGLDPVTGAELREIPGSAVFVDRIDDDVTGEAATSFTANVNMSGAGRGTYSVVVVGHGTPSQLSVHAFSTDRTAQPQVREMLNLGDKERTELRLHFNPEPGSTPRLEKIAPSVRD